MTVEPGVLILALVPVALAAATEVTSVADTRALTPAAAAAPTAHVIAVEPAVLMLALTPVALAAATVQGMTVLPAALMLALTPVALAVATAVASVADT